MPKPGRLNLLTDVAGLLVGHDTDQAVKTGVTVVRCIQPMTAAVDVRGGGPGTRELDVLGAVSYTHLTLPTKRIV